MSRLMAKTLEVEHVEKGNPLQSKLNAFTNGKNIEEVVNLAVGRSNGSDRVVLLYKKAADGAPDNPRVYFKVFNEPTKEQKDVDGTETTIASTALQTKINAFTGGDSKVESVLATAITPGDDQTLVVVAHTRKPGAEDNGGDTPAAAEATASE